MKQSCQKDLDLYGEAEFTCRPHSAHSLSDSEELEKKSKENKTTEIEINDPQNHGDGVLRKLMEERDAKFLAAEGKSNFELMEIRNNLSQRTGLSHKLMGSMVSQPSATGP